MYEDVHEAAQTASIRKIVVVGGEFKRRGRRLWARTMKGPGVPRGTGSGIAARTQTPRLVRGSWAPSGGDVHCADNTYTCHRPFHGPWHANDHALMRWCDSRLHARTIVMHDEAAARAGPHDWGNDLDHLPLETTLREGWLWSTPSSAHWPGAGRTLRGLVAGRRRAQRPKYTTPRN